MVSVRKWTWNWKSLTSRTQSSTLTIMPLGFLINWYNNTWYVISVCKLVVLTILFWSYIFFLLRIFIIIYTFENFSHRYYLILFHWGLSENKSHQVSRTLLSILADLIVVWMVFTYPLISKSFSTFTKPFQIVPSASITIGITVTFMFQRFLVIIFVIQLKRNNCLLTDHYQREIANWNYIIVHELLALDRNTWKYTAVCKLIILDKNTSYMTTYKNSQTTKNT